MKKYLVALLFIASITNAAVRKNSAPTNVTGDQTQEVSQPQIVYIPVPVPPQGTYNNEQQQRDLFLTFMTIAGNFGKILLNPDDTPHVIEGVNTIIDGVMHAAELATRSSSRCRNYTEFVEAIALYIQEQAKRVQSETTDTSVADEPLSAREQLMQLALEQAGTEFTAHLECSTKPCAK